MINKVQRPLLSNESMVYKKLLNITHYSMGYNIFDDSFWRAHYRVHTYIRAYFDSASTDEQYRCSISLSISTLCGWWLMDEEGELWVHVIGCQGPHYRFAKLVVLNFLKLQRKLWTQKVTDEIIE